MAGRISTDLLSLLHIPSISTLFSFLSNSLISSPFHPPPTTRLVLFFSSRFSLIKRTDRSRGGCWPLWQCSAVWGFAVKSNQTHCSQTGQHTALLLSHSHPSLSVSDCFSSLYITAPLLLLLSAWSDSGFMGHRERDWQRWVLGCLFKH